MRAFKTRLSMALVIALVCGAVHAQAMPSVTPISSVPHGVVPGGIETDVTYEIGGTAAANDGAAGSAAAAYNDATYVTRAVTIGDTTMGEMLVGAASRVAWPLAIAVTLYAAYKWYTANGHLMSPGSDHPSTACSSSSGYYVVNGATACTIPGAAQLAESQYIAQQTSYGRPPADVSTDTSNCTGGQTCQVIINFKPLESGAHNTVYEANYYAGNNSGVVDPAYSTQPQQVTPQQVGDALHNYPDAWPQILTDPQTGQPVITPEIADDMDSLKKQIAPRYGVDPTTLPKTTPDPDYPTGQSVPKEQNIPQYCAWASQACDYYKFVEDNWPDATDKKKEMDSPDCVSPPSCSGDDLMCAVVRNTWAQKCSMDGTADPNDPSQKPKDPTLPDLQGPDVDTGDTSKINSSGLGWSQSCPFTDISITIGGQTAMIPMTPICDFGPWLRAFILMMAGLRAAMIVAGLRDVTK